VEVEALVDTMELEAPAVLMVLLVVLVLLFSKLWGKNGT
jgi:hypothetical protein